MKGFFRAWFTPPPHNGYTMIGVDYPIEGLVTTTLKAFELMEAKGFPYGSRVELRHVPQLRSIGVIEDASGREFCVVVTKARFWVRFFAPWW